MQSKIGLVFESLSGALLMAFHLLAPFMRPWRLHWGATPEEVNRKLPGDERVKEPRWSYTHAITIQAPVSQVWPWIAQLGQEKGALYSYEGLENLTGCKMRNANEIVPEWQNVKVGDKVRLGPEPYPFFNVVEVQPERALVLHNSNDPQSPAYAASSWVFYVEAIDAQSTRLLERGRSAYTMTRVNRLGYGQLLVEPIGFVMERKMLLGIKKRAETRVGVQPLQNIPNVMST
ncbi:MAG: hypothetical protein U0694_13095 [Anaerolineae bacterium]